MERPKVRINQLPKKSSENVYLAKKFEIIRRMKLMIT